MATLPADRTKLALAQENQIASAVASAQRNIDTLTEAYDTVDLLNAKVDVHANSPTLPHADGSVTTAKLANSAVTTAKLADSSVTAAKVANGVITADKFVAGALTNETQNGLRITALEADVTQLEAVIAQGKTTPQGPRGVITYRDTTSVYIRGLRQVVMGGFRFMGQYTKEFASYGKFASYPVIADVDTDLGAQSSVALSNWYAVFAVMNDGSNEAAVKIMPFLRVKSVASSVCTLGEAGESANVSNTKTYSFTENNLAGVDCLVINETIDSRANAFSGRVTTITANTTTSVTLETIGNVGAYDYLLPAPPGFDHYCYLGSFYMDTAEVRNIADTGTLVGSTGVVVATKPDGTSVALGGALGSGGVDLVLSGYIAPLATSCLIRMTQTISAGNVGTMGLQIGHDNSHATHDFITYNDQTAARTYSYTDIEVPFSFWQKINVRSFGTQEANTTRTVGARGWIEP